MILDKSDNLTINPCYLYENVPSSLRQRNVPRGIKKNEQGVYSKDFDSPPDFVVTGQASLDFTISLHDTFAHQGKYLMWFFFFLTHPLSNLDAFIHNHQIRTLVT